MDEGHLEWLERRAPDRARARLALFLDYATDGRRRKDVPDPYYGGAQDYEAALDLIEPAMPACWRT